MGFWWKKAAVAMWTYEKERHGLGSGAETRVWWVKVTVLGFWHVVSLRRYYLDQFNGFPDMAGLSGRSLPVQFVILQK